MEEATTSAPVGSAKRLIITEMVLENFKSYAGVQRVGPFHKARMIAPCKLPHTRDLGAGCPRKQALLCCSTDSLAQYPVWTTYC